MNICGSEITVHGRFPRIARLTADKHEFLDDPEAVLEQLKKSLKESKTRADLFTFMQRPPETSHKYSYPSDPDNLAVLSISTYDEWWTKQLDSKTRNMVRKGEKKGVELREVPFDDALVQGIWQIYNECPTRQGKPFAHYGKDIETVRREAGTFLDRAVFIGAFLDGNLIGFIKLICDPNLRQSSLMHIIAMVQHRDKAPTNALIAQAVRSCADRKIPYLIYANFSYGKKQSDSLSDFKESNGFKQMDLPRYYVPLSAFGALALRFGLHRKLANYIPESVLARVRKLRSDWYARKLPSAVRTS
jgi:hypothetical protein